MTDRALVKTLWPPLRRGPGRVQFGLDPERAVVVEGLTAAQVAALDRLDGLQPLPEALADPASADLMALLREHGLVAEPDPTGGLAPRVRALLAPDAEAASRAGKAGGYAVLGKRARSRVLVVGRGSLPYAVTSGLRRAGAAARCAPEGAAHDRSPGEDDLVVLTAAHAVDPAAGQGWWRQGTPVLPVVLHPTEAVVGPVVRPGGPCLRCLDLTRADLDPAWPVLLSQLVRPAVGAGADVSGETALVQVGASLAATVALAVLDGASLPLGRSLEVGLPWPRVRERSWPAHPRCGCGASDASRGPADESRADQDRMAG